MVPFETRSIDQERGWGGVNDGDKLGVDDGGRDGDKDNEGESDGFIVGLGEELGFSDGGPVGIKDNEGESDVFVLSGHEMANGPGPSVQSLLRLNF